MTTQVKFIILAVLCVCSGDAAAINLVQNPGFEQGVAGWHYDRFAIGPNPLWAHSAPGMARLTLCATESCLDTTNHGAFLSQQLATTAGQAYELSFWVRSFTGASRLSVFWDGGLLSETGTPDGPMLQYSFSGLVASANATMLEVHGYNSLNEHMSFDDFSVVPSIRSLAPAPALEVAEPGAFALLLAAVGALVHTRRRKH